MGGTPLIPLRRLTRGLPGTVHAKLEYANPGGSVKDRAGLWMVLAAEQDGRLGPGVAILDATSGNTGVALALVGAVRGHAVVLCMPDKVSAERRRIAEAFGARVVATDPLEGTDGAIVRARELASESGYAYLDQYSNPANPLAHRETTAPEIWEQSGGALTHVVAGVGTSGTVMGISAVLRPRGVRIVAVQPDDPFHGIEGWKHMPSAIRPPIWDESAADRHLAVATDEAVDMARRLARDEGIFTGPSGGGAVVAALRVAREEGGRVVVLIADGGERYITTPLWEG
ncbi:MAG TPA: pyridoxal-phosphate dependent enzyme [Candidatus Limnocylindria bacterium]|nr:pyridoxal-phosphate dependent enzyme [Candidatus Limnocylindria bacterium]